MLFLLWDLKYRSDDGPKNGSKLVTFVINCVVNDGTPLDTFSVVNMWLNDRCSVPSRGKDTFALRSESLLTQRCRIQWQQAELSQG